MSERPQAGRAQRLLLIGHQSAVRLAIEHARRRWPAHAVHLLAYGRSADEYPAIPGVTCLELPRLRPLPVVRFLRDLRRRRYGAVVVAQPHLEVSRARGALVGLAAAARGATTATLDPDGGTVTVIARTRALRDCASFIALYLGSRALAGVLAPPAAMVARSIEPATMQFDVPPSGTVVYLRTDLDLAIAPLYAGGSLAHTEGILDALVQRGHRVELWSTGPMAGMPAEVREHRLRTALRANLPWEIAELLSTLLQVRRVERPPDVAFVYQRYSMNNLTGLLLARRWGVPLVLEANVSEVDWREGWSSLQFPRLARALEALVLRGSHRIATVSANAARELYAAGAPRGRLKVVPNGVRVERFADAAPAALPFDDGDFVIAFSGLFYPWHGARVLAAAFVDLHARRPNARLLLVGDGEDAPLVLSLLHEHDLGGALLHTGLVSRDDVPGYLAAADVVVSPHVRNDAFIGSPIKIWEYMASGRAIVASDVAQMGSVLQDGVTACLVAPDDPRALADALDALARDRVRRERLGRAAQAEASREHSWHVRLAATLDPSD